MRTGMGRPRPEGGPECSGPILATAVIPKENYLNTRIVVVEDEPEIQALLCDIFDEQEWEVVAFTRPRDALARVPELEVDLFLLDVMLPGMSGIELAASLRDRGFGRTPMIAMSASRLMSAMATASGQFQDVLDKPFDLDMLVATTERILASGPCAR